MGVAGAAGAVIKVAGSAAIGIIGGWVNRRYNKSPTGALLDSGRLCILGGLVAVGWGIAEGIGTGGYSVYHFSRVLCVL